jgi:4-alpha-glucanotransferase
MKYRPAQLYAIGEDLKMMDTDLSELVASYLGLSYAESIHYEQFQDNILPRNFCEWNSVAPITTETGDTAFFAEQPL